MQTLTIKLFIRNNNLVHDETIIDNPMSGIIPLQYGSVLPINFYHMDISKNKGTGGLQSPSRIEAVPFFTSGVQLLFSTLYTYIVLDLEINYKIEIKYYKSIKYAYQIMHETNQKYSTSTVNSIGNLIIHFWIKVKLLQQED
jgi:hypothetical protein